MYGLEMLTWLGMCVVVFVVVLANIGDGSGSPSASPLLAENVAECVRCIQHEIGPYSHLVACANKHSSNYMSR